MVNGLAKPLFQTSSANRDGARPLSRFMMMAILACLLGSPALHAAQDRSCAASFNQVQIEVEGTKSESKKASLLKETQNSLSLLRKVLPQALSLPDGLKIMTSTQSKGSSYQIKTNTIVTSAKAPTVLKRRLVLLHELGHALMEASMNRSLPTGLRETHQRMVELMREKARLEKTLMESADSIGPDYQKLVAKLSEVTEALEPLTTFHDVSATIQEFFADSVAVIVSGDPQANAYDLLDPTVTFTRDFTTPRTAENLQKWKDGLNPSRSWGMTRHYAFAPARWGLWELIQNRLTTEEEKRMLLAVVHQVTVEVMAEFMTTTNEQYQRLLESDPDTIYIDVLLKVDLLELNNRLIERLQQALK